MKSFSEINLLNQQERDSWVLKAIQKYFLPGTRTLDVGAGTQPYRQALAHCIYVSHDFGKYPGVKLGGTVSYAEINVRSDILAIPLEDESIDNLICTEVLEHVPDPLAAVGEFARLLRPGGVALVTAPFTSGSHQEPYHFYGGFSRYFYEHAAKTHGFQVLEIQAHGGFLRLMAQELGRLAEAYRLLPAMNYQTTVPDIDLNLLKIANELLLLDPILPNPSFSIGFHVLLQKQIPNISQVAV